MYHCNFCESTFSSKNSLNHHQKTAKYCLQKQSIENNFTCSGCKKNLSSKRRLETHIIGCIEYSLNTQKEKYELELKQQNIRFQNLISEKDRRIKELEDRMDSLLVKAVSRPTVINSNTDNRIQQTINNLIPITDDHLKEQAQFLTLDHIKQGALGYANFACDYALKDRITCVDVSRRKVKYKNQDGLVITDPEMSVLSKKLFSSIQEKNTELTRQYKKELRELILQKFVESGDDMTDEQTSDLDKAIEEINKHMENVSNLDSEVTKIAEGEKPNIYHEFIKEVCNKTVG